jgi:hypothetical protein
MNQYNLDLLAVTEARWTQSGKQKLSTGEGIMWSGRKDDNHNEGVALIINRKHGQALLQRKPVSERLLYVRMNSRYVKLSILVACVPINGATEEDKDQFYSTLRTSQGMCSSCWVISMLVGSNNTGRERITRKHGKGECT